MSLLEKFANHSIYDLVVILESGDDYTAEAKEAARTIIELEEFEPELLHENALNFWQEYVEKNIKEILWQNVKPTSEFLSEDELKGLLLKAFEKFREKLDLFDIDTTKYWFV